MPLTYVLTGNLESLVTDSGDVVRFRLLHPPIGAKLDIPAWMAAEAYNTPQGMPLAKRETGEPLAWLAGALGGAMRWAWDVVFGKRNEVR